MKTSSGPGIFIFSALSLCLAAAFLISTASCRRPIDNQKAALMADTLQRLVTNIDNELVIEEDTIRRRNDSMVIKLNYIKEHYKDTTNGEANAALTRYRGIHANYDDFLKNYPVMEFDEERHKKTVQSLKEKALAGKLSADEFEQQYETEKRMLTILLAKAHKVTYNTITIEEDYRRNDGPVTQMYHQLGGKSGTSKSK